MNISVIQTTAVMPFMPQSQPGHSQLSKSTSSYMMLVHIINHYCFNQKIVLYEIFSIWVWNLWYLLYIILGTRSENEAHISVTFNCDYVCTHTHIYTHISTSLDQSYQLHDKAICKNSTENDTQNF